MARTRLNRDMSKDQTADIVSFLKSLSGEFPTQTMPRLPATPGDLLDQAGRRYEEQPCYQGIATKRSAIMPSASVKKRPILRSS